MLSWTNSFYGIQHMNGLQKRYRATLVEYPSSTIGYIVDKEDHPFTKKVFDVQSKRKRYVRKRLEDIAVKLNLLEIKK